MIAIIRLVSDQLEVLSLLSCHRRRSCTAQSSTSCTS